MPDVHCYLMRLGLKITMNKRKSYRRESGCYGGTNLRIVI